MAISQRKSVRKPTGGRYKDYRKKKKHELGRRPTLTKLGEKKLRQKRVMGGSFKQRLLQAETANVFDPKEKKHFKLKIEAVVDNPANKHFVRRSIITKGTIIKTEKGNAKVLSRPGQDGIVNAVLI